MTWTNYGGSDTIITAALWNANIRQNLMVLEGCERVAPRSSLKQVIGGLVLALVASPRKFSRRALFGLR